MNRIELFAAASLCGIRMNDFSSKWTPDLAAKMALDDAVKLDELLNQKIQIKKRKHKNENTNVV